MKKILTILMGNGLIATFSVVACFLAVTSTNAAPLISARITQIIQDVKLLPSNAAPRPAVVNDDVHQGTAVRTGQDSRTELTFTDKTLTRLGANSVFSFDSGASVFSLGQGSILMQVPPNGSSVKVKTAAVTAAITGGTAIFGTGPPVKFMVLEGTGTFYPNGHPEETMTLHGGEMVTFTADGHMIGPTTFNVKLVMESSELIVPFDDLANLPLIYDVISQQLGGGPQIAFNDQTRTFDETDQAQNALPTPAPSESPGPTGTPSKFGTPATIGSPNPYVITNGTQIQTDPSITTNGVTDFGKIYRGPETDGPFSAYAFGSTSSFDTTSGFDSQVNSSGAVFKFQSLQLTGDPTVNTTNGETSLALIGVDGITSAGPGGTLTFAGIQGLLFATQNGAINLGSEISFSGTGDLNFYARGAGSNLTLASPISGFTNLRLYSGGTTQINGDESATNFSAFSGGDVNIDGATLTSEILNISGAGDVNIGLGKNAATLNAVSISLSAQHDLNWSGQTSDETATNSDGNVAISAGNAINILTDLDIKRTNGGRTSGLNITLGAGADLTVGGNLSLSTDASNIQNGGNISVTSGGDTTIGGSFILHTVGLAGTATGTGGNITVNSGGNLLAGDLDFTVDYNTPDVSVNNGANLTLNVGGNLTTTQGGVEMIIYTPIAGTLTNGGNLSLSVGGDLNTAKGGDVNLTVVNTISTTVPNGANLFASIGGNLNANAVNVQIENDLSGGIGTGGNLTFNVSGDLNASSLLVQLSNSAGGHIANGGDITFHVGGDLTVAGDANFVLLNGGGTIGGNVAVTLSAVNVSANSLTAEIDNNGGVIGSSATINSNISGNVNVTNDVTLEILGSSETTPVEAININGGTYDIGGTFLATIAGDGVISLNNANIRADQIKITAFGANGTLNIGGGTISADTMLKLYAAGSNGSINFVANVTLNSQSTATLIQAVSVTIVNGVIVTIAGPAAAEVFTDHPNYSSTDTSGNPTGGNDSTTGKFAGSGANTTGFSGPTPTPSGTPSKFGPPTTIASPVPYVVTSNTVIQTDPTITTNGVTDYGKIWRGPATDGPLSAFIFGSTSSFDTASAFDILLGGGEGGAGFKFTALQLAGDPTISTTNGEINLGLIAVNGITSGAPGGVLTFAGIRGLLLATQNGPITLGPEISFSGLHDINIYARGSSSDLTLGSDISTSNRIILLAERDMSITSSLTTEFVYAFAGRNIAFLDPAIMHAETIMLSAGQDLTWNGQTSDVTVLNSVGNVDIVAGNQISIINALEIVRRFGGGQSSGLIVSFAAGTDLTAGNGLTVLIDNSGEGNMDSGVNARLDIGGNVTINGAAGLSLTIDNSGFGHIGTGGNITVTTGGGLTADSIFAFINNRNGGTIDSGGNLIFDIGGALTTQGDATFGTSNRNDGNGGGTITGDALVGIQANSISVGGFLTAFLSTNGGGDIQGNAINTVNVSGNLTAHDGIDLEIDDTIFGGSAGGHIGGNAIVTLNAQNITTSSTNSGIPGTDLMAIEASIYPNASGAVGGSAIVNVSALQNISAPGSVLFWVANGNYQELGGGTIGGDAVVNVSAASISTGDLFFQILNYGGASIGADGTLNMNANTLSVNGSLNALLDNTGGSIGGSANVNFNLSGNLTTSGDANFTINNAGGTVGSDALINVNTANISTGGNLDFKILNSNGSIGGDATIDLVANEISVGGDLNAYIDNTGGSIGGKGGSVSLESFGAITVSGRLNVLGTVLTDGDVTVGTLSVTNLDTQGNNLIVGGGGITRFQTDTGLTSNSMHTLTAAHITSLGGINFDGSSALHSQSTITLQSGASTLAAALGPGGPSADMQTRMDTGDTSGLSFGPAAVGAFGTFTSPPPGSPAGTMVINIPPGDGENGFFLSNFTLPQGSSNIHLSGSANMDDTGRAFLNGNAISPSILGGDPNRITQFGNATFSTQNTAFFQPGTNSLLISDSNTGGGPSGGAFFVNISFLSPAMDGGQLTINTNSLSFGPTAPTYDIVGSVTFNGGDGSADFGPGSGGAFTVNATNDITVDSDIEATSGRIQPGASPSGNGGEVNLNSSNGTVTVNNRVEVSSAEPSSTIAPVRVRQSAKGGKIGITSAKTSGVAINIGSSAQLLSLLNAAAPGPGGSIKIVASKAGGNGTNSSSININNANGDPGAIVADRGTVEIRHDGDGGAININNANIRADVVKVGALGLNGTLNIGGGSISADTILKLYATGSNGQLNFISNVTLSSGTAMHLAANTITIQPSIIVTINGTGGAANVYTNHPNYSGFGGTTPANGTFAGNGATNPQPLGNAPGF